MRHGNEALLGSAIAMFLLLASSSAGAGDLTGVPTGTGAQVGGAIDSATGAASDAANGTSKDSMKKVADDAAKQGESAAKEKEKSAADQAIDSVGSGAGSH
jgi:hypothetical protein